jgi:hypothetical protein
MVTLTMVSVSQSFKNQLPNPHLGQTNEIGSFFQLKE